MPTIMTIVLVAGLALGGGAGEPVAVSAEIHCGVVVAPLGSDEVTGEPVCFDTPEALDAYMHGYSSRPGVQAAAAVALGTLYEHSGYGGSSLSLYGAGSCAGTSYGFASLSGGWDSRVSSARGLNGCSLALYTVVNYGGTMWDCGTGCSSLPGLVNDQVRSVIAR